MDCDGFQMVQGESTDYRATRAGASRMDVTDLGL
jgi:hypothetical protein